MARPTKPVFPVAPRDRPTMTFDDEGAATFADAAITQSTDDMVTRTGLIFKAGDYRPKRDFCITPDELKEAAATFAGVDAELEHHESSGIHSWLDGKLGRLTAVWTNEDGTELFGDVAVPVWADKYWGDLGRKVSTVWRTVNNKKILSAIGLCGVLDPVVAGTALFAEYAAFAGQRHSGMDMTDLQVIHDIAVKQGASCPEPTNRMEGTGPTSLLDEVAPNFAPKFAEKDTSMPVETTEAKDTINSAQFAEMKTALGQMSTQFTDVKTALEGRITSLETENKALAGNYMQERSKRIQSEAAQFAESTIASHKAFPYQRESLVMRYVVAVNDDASHGPVQFAENDQKSRLEILETEFASAQSHKLSDEQIKILDNNGQTQLFGLPNAAVTPSTDVPAIVTAERIRELMNKTDLGKDIASHDAAH